MTMTIDIFSNQFKRPCCPIGDPEAAFQWASSDGMVEGSTKGLARSGQNYAKVCKVCKSMHNFTNLEQLNSLQSSQIS